MNYNEQSVKSYDISSGFVDDGYTIPFQSTGADVLVYLAKWNTNTSLTDPVLLTAGSDYTVSSPNISDNNLRKVILSASGKRDGYDTLVIYRNTDMRQLVDLRSGSPIDPDVLEAMADRLYSITQELKRNEKYAIRFPLGSDDSGNKLLLPGTASRANKYIGFDSEGDFELTDFRPYVEAAAQSEANAKSSEKAAALSEANALASEKAAAQSEANAKQYEAESETQVALAKAEVVNAKAEVVNAQTEVSNAKAEVEKAKEQVALATAQADSSAQSASEAKTSETNAKTSETNAKTSETNAAASYEKAYNLTNARCSINSDGQLEVEIPDGGDNFTFSIADNMNLEVEIS